MSIGQTQIYYDVFSLPMCICSFALQVMDRVEGGYRLPAPVVSILLLSLVRDHHQLVCSFLRVSLFLEVVKDLE